MFERFGKAFKDFALLSNEKVWKSLMVLETFHKVWKNLDEKVWKSFFNEQKGLEKPAATWNSFACFGHA